MTYVYDADNDLTSLKFSGTGATGTVVRVDFGYDARGEQTTITWYGNLSGTSIVAYSAYNYDSVGNLTAIANKSGTAATLSYYDYAYNNLNLVTTQSYWSSVGTTTYSGTIAYAYDKADQLTSDSTTSYSYDKNGNRSTAMGYTTTIANEIVSDGTYTYAYDAEGNTTSKTTGSGGSQITWTYSYDNANELTGVVETQGGTTLTQITYSYDAEGDRVQQQVWTSGTGTVTTRFAIDPLDAGNTWMDMNGSNSPLVRYEFGPDANQIVTRTIASGTYVGVGIYFTDLQGSVRDIANWSGVLQDHIDYTSFGVPTESTVAAGDRYKFDGYQYEVTTGLYYDFARWYNPSTGNWLTQDPSGFDGGDANLQRYVGNDPTNETDPTGLAEAGGKSGRLDKADKDKKRWTANGIGDKLYISNGDQRYTWNAKNKQLTYEDGGKAPVIIDRPGKGQKLGALVGWKPIKGKRGWYENDTLAGGTRWSPPADWKPPWSPSEGGTLVKGGFTQTKPAGKGAPTSTRPNATIGRPIPIGPKPETPPPVIIPESEPPPKLPFAILPPMTPRKENEPPPIQIDFEPDTKSDGWDASIPSPVEGDSRKGRGALKLLSGISVSIPIVPAPDFSGMFRTLGKTIEEFFNGPTPPALIPGTGPQSKMPGPGGNTGSR